MKTDNRHRIILILTVFLCLLISTTSLIGIFSSNFYAKESINWQVQAVGQDILDLFFVVPAFLATAVLIQKRKAAACLLWAGIDLYIIYTFAIYSFDIHFNRLFLVYCVTLGLSFYSFFWFILNLVREPLIVRLKKELPIKITGIYLIIIAVIFCLLWLSEIIPGIISNRPPKSLTELGLFTNPVHTLDLSIFLPGIFASGLLVLRKRPAGYLFTFIILAFSIIMDVAIACLSFIMKQKGLESNLSISIVMILLASLSLIFLFWDLTNTKLYPSNQPGRTYKS